MSDKKEEATIGALLKSKRRDLEIEVENISEQLNIGPDIIRNLEEENWHLINKNLYLTGLILSYSKILMIDRKLVDSKIKNLNIKSNIHNKDHQLVNIGENLDLTPDNNISQLSIIVFILLTLITIFSFHDYFDGKDMTGYQKLINELAIDEKN